LLALNDTPASDGEPFASVENTNVCAAQDPLNTSMASADERGGALKVKVRDGGEKELSEITQLSAAMYRQTERNILIEDVGCEDGKDTRHLMRVPSVTPALSNLLGVTALDIRTSIAGQHRSAIAQRIQHWLQRGA
jgi:hypothetical protein